MFLNCDLQVWYLSLNMIETQSMQVMYRVTLGANHFSAELICGNSDIWNCIPWLDIHHKSIDLIRLLPVVQDGSQGVKAALLLVALGPGCAVCCVMKKLQASVGTSSSVSAVLLTSQPQSVCAFKLL